MSNTTMPSRPENEARHEGPLAHIQGRIMTIETLLGNARHAVESSSKGAEAIVSLGNVYVSSYQPAPQAKTPTPDVDAIKLEIDNLTTENAYSIQEMRQQHIDGSSQEQQHAI